MWRTKKKKRNINFKIFLYKVIKMWYYIIVQRKQGQYPEREKGEQMEQMNENEQKKVAIEKYINIQRIKKHGQEEIEYQEKIAKAELQILGISTEDLEIEQKEKAE